MLINAKTQRGHFSWESCWWAARLIFLNVNLPILVVWLCCYRANLRRYCVTLYRNSAIRRIHDGACSRGIKHIVWNWQSTPVCTGYPANVHHWLENAKNRSVHQNKMEVINGRERHLVIGSRVGCCFQTPTTQNRQPIICVFKMPLQMSSKYSLNPDDWNSRRLQFCGYFIYGYA